MTYEKKFEAYKAMAEKAVAQVLSGFEHTPSTLKDAICYSLSNGGKRVRPVLFYAAYSLFNSDAGMNESADLIAVAIECIHTYSLIHDDLPCMDDDDFRRGKPTSHKVFGEAMAVLAGDALLNLAYELCLRAIILSGYNKNYVQAAAKIAELSGKDGLIAGQSLDIGTGAGADRDAFDYIYRHKTADLFVASVYSGALCAGGDEKDALNLADFAKDFGYAFQIQDDLLDKVSCKSEDGSKIISFVDVFGADYSKKTVEQMIYSAIASLNNLNKDVSFLKEFALTSIRRKV